MADPPDRMSLRRARALLGRHAGPAASAELVAVADAAGRVLATALDAPLDWPEADCAALDGYALRAADTEGAGAYAPVLLALSAAAAAAADLPPRAAARVRAGDHLPPGADAVLPPEAAQGGVAGGIEVIEQAAPGSGVDRRGAELRAGVAMLPAGRRLRPQDVALLAALGIDTVPLVRRPVIGLTVGGRQSGALAAMLRALVGRDGGLVSAAGPADLLLAAGDPDTAAAGAGAVERWRVALRPGEQAGFGRANGVAMLLLPDAPLACLAAYDMLAGPLIRRVAGGASGSPYATVEATLDRKIVSAIGFTDLVRVRVAGGRALPLGAADGGGLASAVRADGFVIVPDGSEGLAPGSCVRVHLYRPTGRTRLRMTVAPSLEALRRAAQQEQFLDVVSRDEAEARFRRHLRLQPLGEQEVRLAQALGRVLARDVLAPVDVPGFDRAGVDGFAVRAEDVQGATDDAPGGAAPELRGADARRAPDQRRRAGDRQRDRHRRHDPARRRCRGHGRAHRPASAGGRTPPSRSRCAAPRRRGNSSPAPARTSRAARRCCGAAGC